MTRAQSRPISDGRNKKGTFVLKLIYITTCI
jgi:hypothetical protein